MNIEKQEVSSNWHHEKLAEDRRVYAETIKSYMKDGVLESQKTTHGPNARDWNIDWTISAYLTLTDKMVQKLGGHIDDLPERVPDTVIFLDKSARPVAWLLESLWGQFADKDTKRPDFDFLHIDRKSWWAIVGDPMTDEVNKSPEDFRISDVPQEYIDAIRARFVVGSITEEDYRDKVWGMPTTLDGQNVLIVDEVRSSGATLAIAKELLRRAIPEASFEGDYFWTAPFSEGKYHEIYSPDGTRNVEYQMYSQPVWYDKRNFYGRKVRDPSKLVMDGLPDSPENTKRKIAWFVESVHPEDLGEDIDERTKKLMQDIATLSYINWREFLIPMTEKHHRILLEDVGEKGLASHIKQVSQKKSE